MQNIDSDLIRGNIDTIILKTMLKEDKYGLDIIKEVSDRSSGTYELKQPTLYSCLKRLENQELISSYWVDSDIGGKRHYYKLTDKGRDFYNKKQDEWAKSKFIIDNLLSNYNYEEYRLVKKDEYDQIIQDKANAPLSSFSENLEDLDKKEDTDQQDENDLEQENDDNLEQESVENFETPIEEQEKTEPIKHRQSFDPDNEYSKLNRKYDAYFVNKDIVYDSQDTENEEVDEFESEDTSNFDNEIFSELDINDSNLNDENETTVDETEDFENDEAEIEEDSAEEPVYFDSKPTEVERQEYVSYETTDQSSNELNILSKLHSQEDEEINTYYGDQKSYVNHLRTLDDSQIEQQDLLDDSLYVSNDTVDESINDFSDAINKLNNFNVNNSYDDENTEDEDVETYNSFQQNYEDDLDELNTLKSNNNSAFFNGFDNAEYNQHSPSQNYDETTTDSSDASFEDEDNYTFGDDYNFNNFSNETQSEEESFSFEDGKIEEPENQPFDDIVENNMKNNFSEIDSIITNNISSQYEESTSKQFSFKPQPSTTYRDKLSGLSKYSRVTLEEEKQEIPDNDEAIKKAKDIAEITKELEEEGIKVKEHYKLSNSKNEEKNYLLINKINLIKSVIMFFGYVFLLSAVYIVLNNTSMQANDWFSIKYFLIGFIPFAVIMIYYGILFMITPHKKITAKYHARIMTFISIIISIQLLLITYCVNLQLGFYSFTQQQYNHLFWIIPTIISFAPIIDNIVYMVLFKSKNFHV